MSDELASLVLQIDKVQSQAEGRRCMNDPDHGKLWPEKSATAIVCGTCGYMEPANHVLVGVGERR